MTASLPTVTGDFAKKPSLKFTAAEAPEELSVTVLKQGEGDEIEAGDQVAVHYLGCLWGGKEFDNSFDRGQPLVFQVGVGQVIRGWDDGLVGQKVGSRVLLSIPAELGYGDFGVPQAGIPAGATLVFVSDIMGIL